jgi:hypothetical protein
MEAPITGGEIDTIFRLAKGLSMAGFFKDSRQPEQAFAKLIFGRDLGLSATQAMTDIHIVEGKPEMSANLQASKVLSSGRHDYRVLKLDASVCSIEFGPRPAPGKDENGDWLPWPQSYGTSEFTMDDARTAGLAAKNNWRSYPRNMLFARAMSNGVAWFCPDITNGIRVYAEGEVRETLPPPAAVDTPVPVDNGSLDEGVVESLRKGVEIAGLDDATLSMWLVDLGVVDVTDLHAALATLDTERAQALDGRLADHVAARDAEQPADAEVVG